MFALTPQESQLLILLLTEALSPTRFQEFKVLLSQRLLYRLENEIPIKNPFFLTRTEFQTLFDFLDYENIPTRAEKSICIEDLSEVPGKWWEQYGYPGIHIFESFCLCPLCLYFSHRATEEMRRFYPGLIVEIEDNEFIEYSKGCYRVTALGTLEPFKKRKYKIRRKKKCESLQ